MKTAYIIDSTYKRWITCVRDSSGYPAGRHDRGVGTYSPALGARPNYLQPLVSAFQYDQLNRLVNVQAFNDLDTGSLAWKSTGNYYPYYAEHFSYDQNGNMLSVNRRGDSLHSGNASMDSLAYHYYYGTNKLKQVTDAISSSWYSTDIDNETDTTNYSYDKNGNLTSDLAGQIGSITWSVYGKMLQITRNSGSSKPNLYFAYGPDGQRVMKLVKNDTFLTYYYYVRDAQGNIMAVYKRHVHKSGTSLHDSITLTEQDIYGSSRLGMAKPERLVQVFTYTGSVDTASGTPTVTSSLHDSTVYYSDSLFSRVLGEKQYELSNHLGNVLATVSDRKLQHSTNTTTIDYYLPDILTATDYYAYGAEMPKRTTSFDSIIVQKDTCIACALLKRKLLGYGGSMTDTTSLKTYLNDSFPLFTQTGNAWLSSLRNCKLLKEYVATGASEAFFEMGLGSSSEYHFGRGDISIEAWVNITDTINNKVIFSTETYSFSFGAMSGVSFLVHGSQPLLELCDGQQDVDLLGSTHLPINTWHHLVATRTGNYWTSWHIYVDGSSISVSDFTGFSYSGLYVTTNLVSGNIDTVGTTPYIGLNDGTSNKWPFIGDYRQVRLYNRVISSSEVTASYNGGCGGPPSDTSKLVMWCPLYEGGGYYGHDISRFNDYGDDWYGGSSPFVRNIDTTCFVNGTAVCKLVNVKRARDYVAGFHSIRKDNEITGNDGDYYDYGTREYDARIGPGGFKSPDILTGKFPGWSPYAFAMDNPVNGIDLDGLELLPVNSAMYRQKFMSYVPVLNNNPYYDVQVIAGNVPDNYKKMEDDYTIVGAWGKDDKLDPRNIIKATPIDKQEQPDDGKDPENNMDIIGGATATLIEWTCDLITYFGKTQGEDEARRKESHQRDYFYTATDLADNYISQHLSDGLVATFRVGPGRGDLINYINDGTLPNVNGGDLDSKDPMVVALAQKQLDYIANIEKIGNAILKSIGVPIDPEIRQFTPSDNSTPQEDESSSPSQNEPVFAPSKSDY